MQLCASGKVDGVIAFHSLSTIWYVLRRLPEADRRTWLLQIVEVLDVVGADRRRVLEAIHREDFHDFEDCLQYECAKTAHAEFIVTGNVKDFKSVTDIKVVTPDEAVRMTENL